MKTDETGPLIVWVDLETGGLDPRAHQILEVAMVVTAGANLASPTFTQRGNVLTYVGHEQHLFVRPTMVGPMFTQIGEWATEQHSKSGLLDEAKEHGFSEFNAEEKLCSWLQPVAEADGGRLYMAGSSVHFDYYFLQARMPRLARLFHHRLLDVSALKLFANLQAGLPMDTGFERRADGTKDEAKHRAPDDIRATIEAARRLRASWRAPR